MPLTPSGSPAGSPAVGPNPPPNLTPAEVMAQLTQLGWEPTKATLVGTGHWSVCFGFDAGGRPLVVRFGHQRDDFDKDRAAYRFASPAVPVPEVIEIGRAFKNTELGCWYAISERADGTPLELTSSERWSAILPAVVNALEGMRTATVADAARWGVWTEVRSGGPIGSHDRWRDYLLESIHSSGSVHDRIPGWEAKLAANANGAEDFAWGERLLRELLTDDELLGSVERGVTHQDMLHGNVLVAAERLTGLFDWGCATYSDHLYDLAMFEFWNPWYPALDVPALRGTLEQRWADIGFQPQRREDRLKVCHLHNGLVHLAYAAHLENWGNLAAIGNRMRELVEPGFNTPRLLLGDDQHSKNQRYHQ